MRDYVQPSLLLLWRFGMIWGQLPKLKAIHVKTTSGKISHARLPPNGARGLHGCTLTDPFRGVLRHSFGIALIATTLLEGSSMTWVLCETGDQQVWISLASQASQSNHFQGDFAGPNFDTSLSLRGESAQEVETGSLKKDILLPGVHRA